MGEAGYGEADTLVGGVFPEQAHRVGQDNVNLYIINAYGRESSYPTPRSRRPHGDEPDTDVISRTPARCDICSPRPHPRSPNETFAT